MSAHVCRAGSEVVIPRAGFTDTGRTGPQVDDLTHLRGDTAAG